MRKQTEIDKIAAESNKKQWYEIRGSKQKQIKMRQKITGNNGKKRATRKQTEIDTNAAESNRKQQ